MVRSGSGGGGGGGGEGGAEASSPAEAPTSPVDRFRKASIRVGKMAAALNAVQEEVAESASLTVPSSGAGAPATTQAKSKRRGSSILFRGGARAIGQPVQNIPDRDNLLLSVLIDALEQYERFATRNVAALPRQLLYAGWLQRIVGRASEAEELLTRAVREAKALSMPYETALCTRELGTLLSWEMPPVRVRRPFER